MIAICRLIFMFVSLINVFTWICKVSCQGGYMIWCWSFYAKRILYQTVFDTTKRFCTRWYFWFSYCCNRKAQAASSINRDHMLRSLYYCLFAPLIYECCSSCTFCSWWTTHSVQRQRRGCNNIPSFLQQTALITCSLCEGCT